MMVLLMHHFSLEVDRAELIELRGQPDTRGYFRKMVCRGASRVVTVSATNVSELSIPQRKGRRSR